MSDIICTGSGDEGKDTQRGEKPYAASNTSLKCDYRKGCSSGQEPYERTQFFCYWDSRLCLVGVGGGG